MEDEKFYVFYLFIEKHNKCNKVNIIVVNIQKASQLKFQQNLRSEVLSLFY